MLTIVLLLLMTVDAFAISQKRYVPDLRQTFLFEGHKVIEPEDDVEFKNLKTADFRIPLADGQQVKKYILLKNEAAETTVFLIDSGLPGASVYIVAGTHGDERAGWYA
ncbi:MAG: succinylglutamate desuccinylase/aspartoacylase family protein, partial [Clostridiales bacterium]|nr:succinylglutamate desuccinylase/aspartoacylase family protein [Clostridiales bacterium]